jgi:hypothetical protein
MLYIINKTIIFIFNGINKSIDEYSELKFRVKEWKRRNYLK